MHAYLETVPSPAGPLTFAVDEAGALLWVRFDEGQYQARDAEVRVYQGVALREDRARSAQAAAQFREYHAGVRKVFDLPIVWRGSAWQQSIWQLVWQIPYGETRPYGQLAAMIGRPSAARAVGRANASLTGFAGGIQLKERLLAHEAQFALRDTGSPS